MENKNHKSNCFFDGKWVGGYRGGLVLEVRMLVNASGMLRMQDQLIFKKNAKPGSCYFSKKTDFAKMMLLIMFERQTAKTEMTARTTRRYHVFIKISFRDGICQSIHVFQEKTDLRFSVRQIRFIMKSCSGSRVPRQKALISNRRTIIPAAPGVS